MTRNIAENFEFPVLTKIQGSLDYPQLQTLINETRANAASVLSELGGGANGHLGLVEDPIKYATVSAIPYIRHVNPIPLVIPLNATQHAANRLLLENTEARKNFKEMIQLEKYIYKKNRNSYSRNVYQAVPQ